MEKHPLHDMVLARVRVWTERNGQGVNILRRTLRNPEVVRRLAAAEGTVLTYEDIDRALTEAFEEEFGPHTDWGDR